MNENISRLMDGELDDAEFERCWRAELGRGAMQAWVCYHVIGDSLRGAHSSPRRFATRFSARFHAALAAEPTVLAPPRERTARRSPPRSHGPWPRRWPPSPSSAGRRSRWSRSRRPPIAKAREATSVRAAQVKPPADVASDYLLAHQEYSPATVIQGGGSYLRAATVTASSRSPSLSRTGR